MKLKCSSHPLPYPLTENDIARGEAEAPDILLNYIKILYSGGTTDLSEKTLRLSSSTADDVIYAVTNGQVKPSKHCLLGTGMKSMTGSRKIVDILNKFGHTLNYNAIEELETDLALSISNKTLVTPDGMKLQSGLATGIAFNNYDEFTETLSGAGTLHNTVGITFQNVPDEGSSMVMEASQEKSTSEPLQQESNASTKSSRKRLFDVVHTVELEPYRKMQNVQYCDAIWMILSTLHDKLPTWVAWNSIFTTDHLPRQTICYLQNICLPPTRMDVIAETLKIAQQVATECKEEYAVVTYDLGIAKPASQLQAQESPKYDNVFVMFGAFHIMMTYFSCIGQFIDGSGGDSIMLDVEVLASGSLNVFLSGKHYNRCKRLHPMLATAFQVLHFNGFLDTCGPIPDNISLKLKSLTTSSSKEMLEELEMSAELATFLSEYE